FRSNGGRAADMGEVMQVSGRTCGGPLENVIPEGQAGSPTAIRFRIPDASATLAGSVSIEGAITHSHVPNLIENGAADTCAAEITVQGAVSYRYGAAYSL